MTDRIQRTYDEGKRDALTGEPAQKFVKGLDYGEGVERSYRLGFAAGQQALQIQERQQLARDSRKTEGASIDEQLDRLLAKIMGRA